MKKKKKNCNGLEQVQEPWVYTGQQIPKTGDKESRPGIPAY